VGKRELSEFAWCALCAFAASACGAKSGLLVETAENDAEPPRESGARAPIPDAGNPGRRDAGPRAGDAWRMLGANDRHSGRSTAAPGERPEVQWRTQLAHHSMTVPVTGPSGNIYVATDEAVWALSATGEPLWSVTAETETGWRIGGAAVSTDERVAVSDGSILKILTSDGALVARVPLVSTGNVRSSAPTIGRDDTIYVATGFPEPPALHAVDRGGVIHWSTTLGDDEMASPPAQTSDGSIYAALWTYGLDRRSHFVKLSSAGQLEWRIELPELARTPSVSDDDRVFVPAANPPSTDRAPTTVYEITPDGEVRLAVPPSLVISEPIALDREGHLYLALAGGVRVVTASGQTLWSVDGAPPGETRLHVWAPLAIAGDGTVIASDLDSTVFGLRDGNIAWEVPLGGDPLATRAPNIAIARDGSVVVGRWDGVIYSLR
jgi:outer membrane protein assembly factor BamB